MFLTILAFLIAYFFAMNIGASGAAASMGVAYGAGAIKGKRKALFLCSIGIFLGAIFGGREVANTIGKNIIPTEVLDVKIIIIILSAATVSLFLANVIGIPLSTSEVTVGAVVGIGIAFQSIYMKSLIVIIIWWILIPIGAFIFVFLLGKLVQFLSHNKVLEKRKKSKKWLTYLLVFTGFLEAFAAGMNNVGNAVGPLIGAGLVSISWATLTGGIFIAAGALFFGKNVLETNGKDITNISLINGIVISLSTAILVATASLYGVPIPLTQVTTVAILGIGFVNNGYSIWKKNVIKRIVMVWVVSPIFSLVIAYGFIKLFYLADFYTVFVIASVMIATVGTISLAISVRREKQQINEQGGGI